jgi:hypothetical protein
MTRANRDVFINCPFDLTYRQFFNAIVFVVIRGGFVPRCALEADDASVNRLDKIFSIISECSYGIHDISRTELDVKSRLPRFNMPLELGMFLGSKRFGGRLHCKKQCIIFDRKKFRYQKFISDIAGQDIHAHSGRLRTLIEELASWLRTHSGRKTVPGGRVMAREFVSFRRKLPRICLQRQLHPDELTFGDYAGIVVEYLTVTSMQNYAKFAAPSPSRASRQRSTEPSPTGAG